MKILNLSQGYYPAIGGSESHMRHLSQELVKLGEDVTVFTTNVCGQEYLAKRDKAREVPALRETIKGVKILRFRVLFRLFQLFFGVIREIRGGYRLLQLISREFFAINNSIPFCPQIVWQIIRFKPDMVTVINSGSSFAYYASVARHFCKFPLAIIPCLHTNLEWAMEESVLKILRKADAVIALTSFERNFLMSNGIDGNRIHIIPPGIDLREEAQADTSHSLREQMGIRDNPIIAYMGRQVAGKGIDDLVQSMELVWEKHPRAYLILAGTRSKKFAPVIEKLIANFDDSKQRQIIRIYDFPEQQKADILKMCDVFAMPSAEDSFGLVYLEAWSMKKPVIACLDSPQATFIVNGEDGLLVPYHNPPALAEAIIALLANPLDRARLGENGYQKVIREYTWEKVSRKLRDLYYFLIQNREKHGTHGS